MKSTRRTSSEPDLKSNPFDDDVYNSCLNIAEDIREESGKILGTLHQQGEQITRTHSMCPDMEQDLRRGEKSLGSFGGLLSKPWKVKKTRAITGPKNSRGSAAESSSAMQKVEEEKDEQDDPLDNLSNILGDIKSMAVDMGSELESQNKALEHFDADTDELNSRLQQDNARGRRLLRK